MIGLYCSVRGVGRATNNKKNRQRMTRESRWMNTDCTDSEGHRGGLL